MINSALLRKSCRRALAIAGLALGSGALAQSSGGIVEGRVMNARSGDFLETARVTMEGTQLETFTDSSGQYRFVGVPAGEQRLRVLYTGLLPQTRAVQIAAGQIAVQD